MTLEEAIRAANKGDVSAATAIGDYYMSNEQLSMPERQEKALPWYEMAATANDIYSARLAMHFRAAKANAIEVILGDSPQRDENMFDAAQNWIRVAQWANTVMYAPSLDENVRAEARRIHDDALFDYAKNLYYLGQYVRALEAAQLASNSDVRIQCLFGVCLYKLGAQNRNDSIMSQAYQRLSILERASWVRNPHDGQKEEMIYFSAACYLATLRRLGQFGVPKDLWISVTILSAAYDTLCTGRIKAAVQQELAHYRKKTFGGYQYVE